MVYYVVYFLLFFSSFFYKFLLFSQVSIYYGNKKFSQNENDGINYSFEMRDSNVFIKKYDEKSNIY